MPRSATHQELRHHHNLLLLCILALFVVLGILAFKYVWVKQTWHQNAVDLSNGLKNYETAESVQTANLIGDTITTIPSGYPLFNNPVALENYILGVSQKTGRDIVILDKNKKIIADSNQANVGLIYMYDNNRGISSTLADGNPRSFNEKSTDYPDGIVEEVVQLKDTKGAIIGAVLISPSNIFNPAANK